MTMNRRTFITLFGSWWLYTPLHAQQNINTSMNILQDLIDQAASGSTISVPPGEYVVNVQTPIRLKSDIILDLTGSTIVASPTNSIFYAIVVADACNNLSINGGTIKGEWDVHLGPTDPGNI